MKKQNLMKHLIPKKEKRASLGDFDDFDQKELHFTVSVLRQDQIASTEIEETIFELDKQIESLYSHADQMDQL